MDGNIVTIDLTPGKPTRMLSGKEVGLRARADYKLDQLDVSDDTVEVKISVPIVTSSFILAMFSKSVRALGYERFFKKYHFIACDAVIENLQINAKYSLQEGSALH